MSLNWKEIDQILEELPLPESCIQKILQPDFSTLLFEIYNRGARISLLISLAQNKTRIHAIHKKPSGTVGLQRFAQFLRSRIGGGKIIQAIQLGGERIVRFTIMKGGEETLLYARLWSGAGNVIAADSNGTILDAFYRRPKRGEVSGSIYRPEETFSVSPTARKIEDYSPRHIPGEGSFNEKIERWYQQEERGEEYAHLLEKAETCINRSRNRLLSSLDALKKREKKLGTPERLKQTADLITSNLHRIPRGSRWCTLEDYFNENREITVELNPRLSPAENAQKCYREYEKSKSGLESIRSEIEKLTRELREIDEQETLVRESQKTENREILSNIIKKLTPKKQEGEEKRETPGQTLCSGGYTLIVGRTAKENDQLLRKYVKGNDYWLHARDYPGAYVFIKNKPGKSVSLDTLLDAGNLALFFSKGRTSGGGECYYTQVKYLRRAKHGKTGLVIPTQEKNLTVKIEESRLDRLFGKTEQPGR